MSAATVAEHFEASRQCAEEMVSWLEGPEAAALAHAELEDQLDARGRELLRRMLQDHLSLRAVNEVRMEGVVDSDGVAHGAVENGHRRPLATIFGTVEVQRLAYRHRGHPNLHPADALLNLPTERHSHGLRRLAAVEASRGSFEEAATALKWATGQHVGKRQVENLSARSATDVEEFYATRARTDVDETDILVISADGKGIVMRPDSGGGLRPGWPGPIAAYQVPVRSSEAMSGGARRTAKVRSKTRGGTPACLAGHVSASGSNAQRNPWWQTRSA